MTNPKRPPLFSTSYQVAKDDVLLTVVIGEQQLGSSIVWLDDNVLKEGDVDKLKVGKGSALVGHRVTIKTVVTDTNDMTDRTSTTIILEGGTAPAEHTLSVDVDENGDSAIYRSKVEFTS
ncbi:MAG TPA: hypothetical protein VGQ17_04455 [Gemmatimonadales bacterium]|jgi:hypothetical protein|nr:hypothetical protein [Gemmatimonadales bacterium]